MDHGPWTIDYSKSRFILKRLFYAGMIRTAEPFISFMTLRTIICGQFEHRTSPNLNM
jgi:hypothetical protein